MLVVSSSNIFSSKIKQVDWFSRLAESSYKFRIQSVVPDQNAKVAGAEKHNFYSSIYWSWKWKGHSLDKCC